MRFDMDGLCTWRQGDECSIPTAPVKTKRSWNVPSEASSKAFGSFHLFHLFLSFFLCATIDDMNPYSGTSTLAKVLRAAALGGGLVYGSVKLGYLKVRRFVPSNEGPAGRGAARCRRQAASAAAAAAFRRFIRFLDGLRALVLRLLTTRPRSDHEATTKRPRSDHDATMTHSLTPACPSVFVECGIVERQEGGKGGGEALIDECLDRYTVPRMGRLTRSGDAGSGSAVWGPWVALLRRVGLVGQCPPI